MITLLHASPTNRELPSLEAPTMKEQMKIPHFCKSDILESLGEREKNLNLKFEILNEETLRAALDTGSRVLYIGSEVMHPDGLVLEKAKGGCELFTFRDMKRIFMGSKIKRQQVVGAGGNFGSDIEMAIVGTKNDEKLANFLVQDLQVKHVIYFKFNREKFKDCYREQLYENVYVTKFLQFYLNELVTGKSVQRSFDLAQQDTINCIADSFFDSNLQEATEYISPGAILLPGSSEINFHHEKFFGVDMYVLPDGKPEDISTRKPPSNVRKTFLPFFGRVKEMDVLVERVLSKSSSSNNQFIKIQGAPGVGKTRFVLELAYHLLQRGCFKDGIFYIPLRRMKNMSFFELLETTINPQALGQRINKNIQSFFRDKEILLIFDDFDLFYTEQIEFPSFIFSTLKRSKVKVIVTCTKYEIKGEVGSTEEKLWKRFKDNQNAKEAEYVGKTYDLPPLENEHLAHLVIALSDTNFDGFTEQEVLSHPTLAQIKGIPKTLIQRLSQEKFGLKDRLLDINKFLIPYLDLDKVYGHLIAKGDVGFIIRDNVPNISRHSKNFTECLKQISQKEINPMRGIFLRGKSQVAFSFEMNKSTELKITTSSEKNELSSVTAENGNLPQNSSQVLPSEEEKKIESQDPATNQLIPSAEDVREESESESDDDGFHLSGVETESSGPNSNQSIDPDP